MSNYVQDITLIPATESLPDDGYLYGLHNNELVRIKVDDFINAIGGTPPIIKHGTDTPTNSTEGKVGQAFINVDIGKIFMCRKITTAGINKIYTWEQIPTYTYLSENFRKVTFWDQATEQSYNYAVPNSYSGDVGDRIIMASGSIWELTRRVTNYGSTTYIWDWVAHGTDINVIKAGALVTTMEITLLSANWSNNQQTVTISGYTVTSNTQVETDIDFETYDQLLEDKCEGIKINNTNGVLTAIVKGSPPSQNITVQVSLREVRKI